MKKDQKFLNELNEKLGNINTKKKDAILLKYKNIIEEEKKNGKKITVIIKSFGNIEEIAKKEIELNKKSDLPFKIKNIFNKKSKDKGKKSKIKEFEDKINDFDNWKDELLIDLSNMPRFSIAISNFDKGKKFTSNIYKLNKYDLLFGSIRPYFGKVGFSPINGVVTGTVHSFKPIDDIYYSLVLSLISSKTFIICSSILSLPNFINIL